MATALVDLYGGETSNLSTGSSFRRAIARRKSEEFMCGKHRAYFLRKLKAWKEAIVDEIARDHGAAPGQFAA